MTPPQPQPTESVDPFPSRWGTGQAAVLRPGHPFSTTELAAMASDGILNKILLDATFPWERP
ncbi:hypothetical protein [Kocuria atrinae]|uniref:hypothetical protein n=1 Tax=Kocuria atrinae TaxID=592377 RepID=UPI000311EFD1|nr:hypothetical protein [Kocuria atrinae]